MLFTCSSIDHKINSPRKMPAIQDKSRFLCILLFFFGIGDNLEWIDYVTKKLKGWQKLIEVWLEWGQTHPLLVVQYEDLVNNTSREIDVMLRFIGIQISLEDIRQKLRVQFK